MTRIIVYPVTVHSCPLELDWLTIEGLKARPEAGRFIIRTDRGVWYRALGSKCPCKRLATKEEAFELVETGQAQHMFDKSVKWDETQIWMQQQMKVPRVDMISKADIERAYVGDSTMTTKQKDAMDYIEEVHELFMANRAKLIVPFRDDPTEGRLLFPFPNEQRTVGGHK